MKVTAEIINIADYQKRPDPNDQRARELAKKIVSAYLLHGEQGYVRAILSATRGDQAMWEYLEPFIREEAARNRHLI